MSRCRAIKLGLLMRFLMINIYYFTIYFFYSFARNKNPVPEHYSVGAVLFMLLSHSILFVGIMNLTGIIQLPYENGLFDDLKLFFALFLLVVYFLANSFFSKRSSMIIEQYDSIFKKKNKDLFSVYNILFISLLFFAPLIIGAKLISI
ncbi:MAG: hypothetical protein JJ895_05410 [Balneolaceae bacterium]|nr:hypothetical protein [Balneolaceae bacterium]